MDGNYEVTMDGQTVGTVELKREGLYYRVLCRCRVGDGNIHRLYAGDEKIGVLIPDRGELILETRIAAKRMKPERSFSLDETERKFVPIRSGEAFAYLDKLRNTKLVFREGEKGILLEK